MDWKILLVALVPLGRAIFGWLENAMKDGYIDLPEWEKLGETIIRMGIPIVALVWGLKVPVEIAAGIVVLADIVISKIYSAVKKK